MNDVKCPVSTKVKAGSPLEQSLPLWLEADKDLLSFTYTVSQEEKIKLPVLQLSHKKKNVIAGYDYFQ